MVDIVQFDPDGTKSVSQRFSDQADQVEALYKKIHQQMEVLRGKAWIGKNAEAFLKIMDETLMPGVQRLSKGLDAASVATNQVAKIIRDADEENKSLFPV